MVKKTRLFYFSPSLLVWAAFLRVQAAWAAEPPVDDPCKTATRPCRALTKAEERRYERILARIERAIPTPHGWRRTSDANERWLGRGVPFQAGFFPEHGDALVEFERRDRAVSIEIHIFPDQVEYNGRIVARFEPGFFAEQVTWGKISDMSIIVFHTPPGGRITHVRSVSLWVTGERRDVDTFAASIDRGVVVTLLREELAKSRALGKPSSGR